MEPCRGGSGVPGRGFVASSDLDVAVKLVRLCEVIVNASAKMHRPVAQQPGLGAMDINMVNLHSCGPRPINKAQDEEFVKDE